MDVLEVKDLLHDKRVVEAINKHLWIESQKAGYSIGIERATEEWLRLYSLEWMKYNMTERYDKITKKKVKKAKKAKKVKKKTVSKKG